MTEGSHALYTSPILQDAGPVKSTYESGSRPLLTRSATEQATSVESFAPDEGFLLRFE